MSAPLEALKALGCSTYEAQAYVWLLPNGPAKATEVSRGADIPSGRVYDALHGLVDKGVAEVVPGRPKRFVALHPGAATNTLLTRLRRDLDAEFDRLTREAARIEESLARASGSAQTPQYQVSLGEDSGHAFLAAQVGRAREMIDVNLRFDVRIDPRDEDVFRSIARAVDRGVRVRALIDESDIPNALESELAGTVLELLGPHLGEGLDVRITQRGPSPFSIIDGQGITLGVRNPMDGSRYLGFLFLHDPPFAKELTGKFDALWDSADMDVVEALEDAGVQA